MSTSAIRTGIRAAKACLTVLLLMLLTGSAHADALEHAVKATFVPKFAPFVQWPPEALGPPDAPMVICAQGNDPVAELIERAATGQSAWGRQIIVRRLPVVNRQSGCHVAYIAGSQGQSLHAALAALRGAPVLTVTDDGSNKAARGMIDFVIVSRRVSFDIDERQAADSHLAISSKLLNLARSVKRR